MYRLFYDYHAIGDILMIIFDNTKKGDRLERKNTLVAIYNNDELIGVNIFNISQIVRIKAKGMIINPASEFIDVINYVLINDGLTPLPKQDASGFIVGQILEIISDEDGNHLAKIDVGTRVIYAKTTDKDLPYNRLVVVALPNTILANGQTVALEQAGDIYCEGRLCLKSELNLKNEQEIDGLYFLEEYLEIGQDFFAKE